jgi:uncharacterized membrane protein YeaQ/YmgE (transglycosylase-associated protein family)
MSPFAALSSAIHLHAAIALHALVPPHAATIFRIVGVDILVEHSILGWLLMGLLAGWLSGELIRGKGFGCLGNILLGLIGAVVGGWLFEQLHIVTYGFIGGLAAATVGAVLVVGLGRLIAGGD